jgi:hypothetical protein
MVVSVNSTPSIEEFRALVNATLVGLAKESKIDESRYLTLLGNKLEGEVYRVLCENAKKTPFEDSIELVSGQKFPDIIAKKFYGIEVKTTKSNHWKSIGSSVAEGTRVEDVQRIFMLFGKMCSPIDFKCRPYEECLSDVVVTHSPRYQIDMTLGAGKTIFDKINVPYDTLRKQPDPIRTVLDYYKTQMKEGESTWWSGDEDSSNKMIVRLWNHLDNSERMSYRVKGFCLFPELLGNRQDKFNRFAVWLATKESIVCPNVRDIYTAGGTGSIELNGKTYPTQPRVFIHLDNDIDEVRSELPKIDTKLLAEYWGEECISEALFSQWSKIASANLKTISGGVPLEEYFLEKNK